MTAYNNIFGPCGAGVQETTARPPHATSGANVDSWFEDCINNDPTSGTKAKAQWFNFIIANFREAVRGLGVTQDDVDDLLLLKCFQAVMLTPSVSAVGLFAECYLSKVSTNLVLSRKHGTRLMFPNGEAVPIPSGGATLAPTGLTPGTLYYIYGFKSGSTVAIEASATAPAVDATSGISIKTGDTSRVLVGKAAPATGPAWKDEDGYIGVLSHFNRRPKFSRTYLTTTPGAGPSTGGTGAEVTSALRNYFITWADEVVRIDQGFQVGEDAVNVVGYSGIAIDTGNPVAADRMIYGVGPGVGLVSTPMTKLLAAGSLSEALHYATIGAYGGALTYINGTYLVAQVNG